MTMKVYRKDLVLNLDTREALVGSEWHPLPRKQFALLLAIAEGRGNVVKSSALVKTVWRSLGHGGAAIGWAPPILKQMVSRLRKKIGYKRIESVGDGYRLVEVP